MNPDRNLILKRFFLEILCLCCGIRTKQHKEWRPGFANTWKTCKRHWSLHIPAVSIASWCKWNHPSLEELIHALCSLCLAGCPVSTDYSRAEKSRSTRPVKLVSLHMRKGIQCLHALRKQLLFSRLCWVAVSWRQCIAANVVSGGSELLNKRHGDPLS